MEALLIDLLKEYGYIVLFFWSILEGEMGLIMAGTLVHTGSMQLPWAIFVAGLGGFTGDQIYFYIGRFSKGFVQRKLHKQRRKFALASLLIRKYGWPIIFIQRYMYGLRTIIPMMIGISKFSAKQYAIINLISAWIWAAMTILPVYWFGAEILNILSVAKQHWYIALPFAGCFLYLLLRYFDKLEQRLVSNRQQRHLKHK